MNQEKPNQVNNPTPERGKQSFLHMLQSVLAAIFGIQSDKNREEDFKKGDPAQYIVLGIVAVLVLMIIVWSVVSSVIESAG